MKSLVLSALSERKKSSWILDGYPRSLEQTEILDSILKDLQQPLDAAIYLDVDQEVIIERVENRRVHPESGRTYHLKYRPPKVDGKDDVTGEPLVQRDDDTRVKKQQSL